MEHALRFHIRKNFDEDPARYTKLSERLDEILKTLTAMGSAQPGTRGAACDATDESGSTLCTRIHLSPGSTASGERVCDHATLPDEVSGGHHAPGRRHRR